MNNLYKYTILIPFLLALTGCFNSEEKKVLTMQMPPMPASVMKVKKADIPITLSYSGQTASDMNVVLKSKVVGTIEKQFFKAGDSVKKGDKLYQIDQAKYKAAYDISAANLELANAVLSNAKANFDRASKLNKKNAISQKEFDAVTAEYRSARANVLVANANLQSSKIDLNHSVIIAPFSGVLGDTLKDVGSYVGVGEDLVRLTQLNPIYLNFGISDTDRLNVIQRSKSGGYKNLNFKATLILDSKDYNGTLSFIDSVVDEDSGTIAAKAKFDNTNLEIRPGTFARIKVYGFDQKDGFMVPQVAILQDIAGAYVYTLDKNNKVEKNHIKIASEDPIYAVVSSGLNDGDKIILDNFKKIRVGQPVSPLYESKGNK